MIIASALLLPTAAIAQPTSDVADLKTLAEQAASAFRPVTPGQVADARRDLRQQVARLSRYLDGGGANGAAWKDYLQWEKLQPQVADDAAFDRTHLAQVYRQFRAAHVGLELPIFANVAESLEQYINLANMASASDQPEQYRRQLEILQQQVGQYQHAPNELKAFQLGRLLGFVDGLGQAPRLVEAVQDRISHPNLRAHLGDNLVTDAVTRPVNESRPVTDVILGTYITGTAHTDATLSSQPIESAGAVCLQLRLMGNVCSNTVGRNGPVCIYSTATTPFCAVKTIRFDGEGFVASGASASAQTHSNIHSIVPQRSGVGSRLIERVAWKRAGQQKGLAESIASRHAEQRIARNFDSQTDELLADIEHNYNQKLRLPLVRRDEFPGHIQLRSSESGVKLEVLKADDYQIGSPTPPPEIPTQHDMALAVHESFANNLANSWLADYRLTQQWLREHLKDEQGNLPPEMQPDEPPWSITFASFRPVIVTFEEGGFTVQIRGRRFTSDENAYGAMNIAVSYTLETTDQGLLLRRQGDVETLPPGFRPGQDTLSPEQAALVNILQKRLAKLFEPEIRTEGLKLPARWKRIGKMMPVHATSSDGWLVLAWNKAAEATIVAKR